MKICPLCQCVFFATHPQEAIQIMMFSFYCIVIMFFMANKRLLKFVHSQVVWYLHRNSEV